MSFPPLPPRFAQALTERGYLEATPVQSAVLLAHAEDRDLLVSAQTGSGKTVAYGLAMIPTLLGGAERFAPAAEPLALIIAPTRELALQVHRELEWLYAHTGAKVISCVGGMDVRREQRLLAEGADIVVGTPGRLRDHLERGKFDASKLRAVVLDEADEMLDLGFREELQAILDATPESRRTLLFSATLPRAITDLAKTYQRNALRIDASSRDQAHGDIEYRAVRIAPNEIEHAVVNVLRYFEAPAALVFCATRDGVRHLHSSLLERGFQAVALSGELSQHDRSTALQAIRDGRARVCVATDVAARGIDLPDLSLVIHADLPNNRETLLHRSGRTGRAGRKGTCVLIVPYTRRRRAETLIMTAGVTCAWSGPPLADEIKALDQQRLVNDPLLSEEMAEEDRPLAEALLAERSAVDIAAALIRLHRARLPAPEDLFDAPPPPVVSPTAARDRPRRERVSNDANPAGGPHGGPPGGPSAPQGAPSVWFRLGVGRKNNADPKWLLPLICRHGHVTKAEIGTIRIFDRETKFEIAEASAAKFVAAILTNNNAEIRIEPAGADRPSRVGEKKPGRFPDRFPKKKPHATPAQIRDDLQPLKKKAKKPKRDE